MYRKRSALGLVLAGSAAIGLVPPDARGSSHTDAPAIVQDPQANNTDVWAWKDTASTIVIVATFNPLSVPSAGPIYHGFSDTALYEIHIDTNGDAVEDVTYQFRFKHVRKSSPGSFLQVTSAAGGYASPAKPDDPAIAFRQTCTVTRLTGPRRNPTASAVQAQDAFVALPNVGPKLTPNYETTVGATAVTKATAEGGKVFAGPRQDAFFIDLGAAVDKLSIRDLDSRGNVGNKGGGVNTLAGFNCDAIAVQVPISTLGASGSSVGVWSSVSRRKVTVLRGDGQGTIDAGRWVQVSRLGNPLVNELFIPFDRKDEWNAREPKDDVKNWKTFFENPEPATLLKVLYKINVPPAPRTDLPGLFAPDTLKVRIDISPLAPTDAAFVSPNGLLLGRTPFDDVVDIYLQAAAGILVPGFNVSPNKDVGDGSDFASSGVRTSTSFPYLGTPYDGLQTGINLVKTPER